MAAIVEWGGYNSPESVGNIYGVKDEFYIRISTNTATYYKLKYRVKVGYKGDYSGMFVGMFVPVATEFFEFNVEPINGVAFVNPLINLYDLYFGEITTGGGIEGAIENAFDFVSIEVGEIYADTASEPATFRGYDTYDSFYCYAGYQEERSDPNYVLPSFNSAPVAVPHSGDIYYGGSDLSEYPLIFYGFSSIPNVTGLAYGIGRQDFEMDGTPVGSPVYTNLSVRPDIVGRRGYWYTIVSTPPSGIYSEYFWVYGTGAPFIESKRIRVQQYQCNGNADVTFVRYINKWGAEDTLLFNGRRKDFVNIKKGKKILSSGLDYSASSVESVKSVNRPNFREIGNERTKEVELTSGWLTQSQLIQAQEIISSPLIIIDGEPYLCTSNEYEVLNVKNGLQQITMRFQYANQLKI